MPLRARDAGVLAARYRLLLAEDVEAGRITPEQADAIHRWFEAQLRNQLFGPTAEASLVTAYRSSRRMRHEAFAEPMPMTIFCRPILEGGFDGSFDCGWY
ncbi:MAG TPA: hypothetical protein VLW45_11010 [Pelomicrobium sp.]|nr:hypothetical protein [Pelomicrobium sp.]